MDDIHSLAGLLKRMHQHHEGLPPLLHQKAVALLFEKPSTRTRTSFDVGIHLLGGHSFFIDKTTTQMSRGEDWKDTTLTLTQYTDALMARVFEHTTLEQMARFSSKPVINGLTNENHPCQILSDLFTMREHYGTLDGLTVMYAGVSDNVTDSLLVGCAMMGMDIIVASPPPFKVSPKYLAIARKLSKKTGSAITVFPRIPELKILKQVNVVYTDEWESMHMHLDKKKMLPLLRPFQVNEKLMGKCARGAKMMHCLPAIKGEEVSPTIMYGKYSLVWEQAQNRMWAQMALLSGLLRD